MECCIATLSANKPSLKHTANPDHGKQDPDGDPKSSRAFSSQIENIDKYRTRNGSHKGNAIFTFESPGSAKLTVNILNQEGQFGVQVYMD